MSEATFQKKLMVTLTEEEIAERGSEMAQETMARLHLELERSAINRKIKPHKERAESLAAIIDAGEEERDVDCTWRYDWAANLRYLVRLDTGEMLEQEVIPPGMKQIDMFETPPPVMTKKVAGMFSGCQSNGAGCVYWRTSGSCPFILCGNLNPVFHRVTASSLSCDCPESERIVESNVVTCGLCKKVIESAPISRESQPVEKAKSRKKTANVVTPLPEVKFGEITPDSIRNEILDDLTYTEDVEVTSDAISAPEVSTPVEEKAENVAEVSNDVIDRNRRCCMPPDRAILMQGDIRVTYCKVCLLIHRKEDTTITSSTGAHPRLDFPIGEKVVLADDEGWPSLPGAA